MEIIQIGLIQSGEPFKRIAFSLAGGRKGSQRYKAQGGFAVLLLTYKMEEDMRKLTWIPFRS